MTFKSLKVQVPAVENWSWAAAANALFWEGEPCHRWQLTHLLKNLVKAPGSFCRSLDSLGLSWPTGAAEAESLILNFFIALV